MSKVILLRACIVLAAVLTVRALEVQSVKANPPGGDVRASYASYREGHNAWMKSVPRVWRSRILAGISSAVFFPSPDKITVYVYANAMGNHAAVFCLLTAAGFIWWFGADLGLYAFLLACLGFLFSLGAHAHNAFLPWDAPMLAIATFACACVEKNRPFLLAALVVVGVAVKENMLVFVPLLLCCSYKNKWSWAYWVVVTGMLAILSKIVCDVMASQPDLLFTTDAQEHKASKHIKANLVLFWSQYGVLNSWLWANCGTLLAGFCAVVWAILLRPFNRDLWVISAIFVVLFLGNVVSSNFLEYRVFLDMLPVSFLLWHRLLAASAKAPSLSAPSCIQR